MILQRLGIVALIAICSLAGYYLLDKHVWVNDVQVEPDAEKPLFTGEALLTTQYNAQGTRTYTIESEHLEHYQKIDETHFNEPVLWTYTNGKDEEWRISSNYAVLENKELLVMTGNVRIFNLLPDATIKHVVTETLTLDLKSRDFWSKTPTTITGVGFQTEGQRVNGNFGSHQMELMEEVKGRYETRPR